MLAYVLEQRVRIEPAAADVDPESFARQRADARRRQLRRLFVRESAKSIVETRWHNPENVGQGIHLSGRDHISLDEHVELRCTEWNADAERVERADAERRCELGQSCLHRRTRCDLPKSGDEIVLRRQLWSRN